MPRVILEWGFPLQRKKQLKIDIDIGPKNSVLCQCQCMELLTFLAVQDSSIGDLVTQKVSE